MTKALVTVSAVISGMGIASDQRVKQSMHASRYVWLFDGGSGPTMLIWM